MNKSAVSAGERLKKLRFEKDITVAQISDLCDISRTALYRFELSTSMILNCQTDTAVKLAKFFGVSLDFLIVGGEIEA